MHLNRWEKSQPCRGSPSPVRPSVLVSRPLGAAVWDSHPPQRTPAAMQGQGQACPIRISETYLRMFLACDVPDVLNYIHTYMCNIYIYIYVDMGRYRYRMIQI